MSELDILQNLNSVKSTPQESLDIYNNKTFLKNPTSSYYQNPQTYFEEKNQPRIDFDINENPITAEMLTDANMTPIAWNNRQELIGAENSKKSDDGFIVSTWNKVKGFGQDVVTGYKVGDISNDIGQAYYKYMHSTDEQEKTNLESEIANLEAELSKQSDKQNTATTVGQIISSALEGEVLAGTAAGIAVGAAGTLSSAGFAAPVATAGGLAIRAGAVYDNTVEIEAGLFYKELKQSNPEMSEDEKKDASMIVGRINGAIEAGLSPLEIGGKFTKGFTSVFRKALAKKIITKEVATETLKNPSIIKKLVSYAIDLTKRSVAEGVEEITQNEVSSAMDDIIKQGKKASYAETFSETISSAREQLKGNLPEKAQQNLEVFGNVVAASMLLGGVADVSIKGINRVVNGKENKGIVEKPIEQTAVDKAFESLLEKEKVSNFQKATSDSKLRKDSPQAWNEFLSKGEQKVYLDVDMAEQLLNDEDEDIQQQIQTLNLAQRLNDAKKEGGKVEIPLAEADGIIFGSEDETLYQKIVSGLSFDDTRMSAAEVDKIFNAEFSSNTEIQNQLKDSKSDLSQIKDKFVKSGMSEEEANSNTALAYTTAKKEAEIIGSELGKLINDINLALKIDKKTNTEELATAENTTEKEQVKIVEETRTELQNEVGGKDNTLLQKIENTTTSLSNTLDSVVAGSFDRNSGEINLTKYANPTTFGHELFHYHTNFILNQFNSGNKDTHYMKSFASAVKWAGGKINEDGQAVLSDDAWEKLANGFTTYLKEGVSPIQDGVGFFGYIRRLFGKTYQMIRALPNIRLNKKVRDFYDQLFLTEQQVEEELKAQKVGALAKPENVSDDDYAKYLDAVEKSKGDATSEALAAEKKLAEKRSTQEYINRFKVAKDEAIERLKEDKRYSVRNDVLSLGVSKESLVNLPDGLTLNKEYIKKGGLPISSYVNLYDENNPMTTTELVNMLNETKDIEEVASEQAKEEVNHWLVTNYPELMNIGIKNATRTVNTMKAMLYEHMMLKGIPLNRFNMNYNEMVNSIEEVIGNRKAKEIANLDKLEQKLYNNAELYRVAERLGKKNDMANIRYRMAILVYSIARGKQIRDKLQKFNRHFDKYKSRPSKSQIQNMDSEAWDIISSVLNKFAYTARKPIIEGNVTSRLETYVKGLQEKNFTNLDELLDSSLFLNNAEGINGKNITLNQFNQLNSSLRILEAAGRESKQLSSYFDKELINTAADKIEEYYKQRKINPWNDDEGIKDFFLGELMMKETFLSKVTPEDVFLKYVSPFMNGLTNLSQYITKESESLAKIIDPVVRKGKKEYVIDGRVYTYSELAVIMFNAGNKHNKDCMIKTLNQTKGDFDENNFNSLINKAPIELRGIAQKVWDFFEKHVPAFKNAQEKISGSILKLVEPDEVVFDDGQKLKGGYYPAGKKHKAIDIDFSEKQILNTSNVFPTYSMGKERTSIVHGDLDLSLNSLESWFLKTAQVINVGEPYSNLAKLLNNTKVREVMGEGAIKRLTEWMKLSLVPEKVSKTLSVLNNIWSVSILSKPIKALVQLSGFIPAMSEIGFFRVGLEAIEVLSNPLNILDVTMSRSKKLSPYMNQRFGDAGNHIADLRKQFTVTGKTSSAWETISNIAMWPIAYGDNLASMITWKAQYKKSLSEGLSEAQATSMADQKIRQLQGDNTAGSRAPIIQGNKRFFTPFASYFIGIYSTIASNLYSGRYMKTIGMLMAAGIMAPLFEVLAQAPFDWWSADDDKKRKWRKKGIRNYEQYVKNRIEENVISSTSSSILPFWGIGQTVAQEIRGEKVYDPTIGPIKVAYDIIKQIGGLTRGDIKPEEMRKKILLDFGFNMDHYTPYTKLVEKLYKQLTKE